MNASEMCGLAAERQGKIREIMRQRGVVRVDELGELLGVSAATVRRDLAELDLRGVVRRVHGGAVAVEGRLEEPVFEDKAETNAKKKQAIAEEALTFVTSNDCIYLDGGSTVLALARLLTDMANLTVVTNSLRVAMTFAGGGPRLVLVGGELRRLSQTFVGALTGPVMDQLHVDKAFMGTIGLTLDHGLTTTDPNEAFTKQMVMEHAEQVYLLADSSKLGKVAFAHSGAVDDVDVLITDKAAEKALCRKLQRKSVNVIRV